MRLLAEHGIGIANLVGRTTARAAQLTRAGGRRLIRRATVLRPCGVAVAGITALRQAFDRPGAVLWVQPVADESGGAVGARVAGRGGPVGAAQPQRAQRP
ncbi:MAG: hypothetical protein L0M05_08905 [Corynebacterium variabile]|uniref:hypothetical protein n=1 Tax=Corynebacterium variabile TaxID=1727 RepID=UPI00264A3BF6|nr:hypothetical protein [Corynebacterium variabile]MDN6844892.1 hypothetical protein [Corynebacterium variabile]